MPFSGVRERYFEPCLLEHDQVPIRRSIVHAAFQRDLGYAGRSPVEQLHELHEAHHFRLVDRLIVEGFHVGLANLTAGK